MPNRRFVSLIMVGFVMSSLSLNIRANEDDITLTSGDRAEIIKDVLSREITRRREEGSKYRTRKKGEFQIILSTLNVKPDLVPKIPNASFIFLEPSEIEERS